MELIVNMCAVSGVRNAISIWALASFISVDIVLDPSAAILFKMLDSITSIFNTKAG